MADDALTDVAIEADATSKEVTSVTPEDAAFWLKEFARCHTYLQDPIKVTVSHPQTSSGWGKSWTTYLVTSPLTTNNPRRRYSDFEWIRGILQSRYAGMFIAPLPPKKMMNQSDEFILERMKGLTNFMNETLRNPYLHLDSALNTFLTEATQSKWDSYKKSTKAEQTAAGLAHKGENEGLTLFEEAMKHLKVPSDAHACCTALKRYVEASEKDTLTSLAAAKKFMERSRAYAEALSEFKATVDRMKTTVAAVPDSIPATCMDVRLGARAFDASLDRTSTALSQWHDLACFQPNEIQLFVVEQLDVTARRLRAMREVLAFRDQAFAAYQSAFQAHQRKQAEHQRLTMVGKVDKATKMEPSLKAAEAHLLHCEFRMNNCIRCILFYEIGRRDADRHTRISEAMGQFASLGIASGLRAQQLWKDFLVDMAFSAEDMLKATQATLSGETEPMTERSLPVFAVERSLDAYGLGEHSPAPAEPAPDAGADAAPAGAGAGAGAGAATAEVAVAPVVVPATASAPAAAAATPPAAPAAEKAPEPEAAAAAAPAPAAEPAIPSNPFDFEDDSIIDL